MKVQLKGRFSLYKKYIGKKIWIAFRYGEETYLYPHDKVVKEAGKFCDYLQSKSWKEHGGYSVGKLSKKVCEFMERYKI